MSPPANYNKGTCNADLPNNSVYTRFLYTVRYLVANNFYVVLDNQLNTDPTCKNNANVRTPGPAAQPYICTSCSGRRSFAGGW